MLSRRQLLQSLIAAMALPTQILQAKGLLPNSFIVPPLA